MRSFLTTFLTGLLAITATYAIPVANIAARSAYTPSIASPNADTVWGVGKEAAVTWDSTKVPKGADPIPALTLYSATGSNSVAQLASNFDALAGSVSFTVPQVSPGSYIVKIGDNASAQFKIAAQAVTYLPTITSPVESTTWKVGKNVDITWEKSAIPDNAAPLTYIDLYTEGFGSGSLFVARLASNVDVFTGGITVTVPQVRSGNTYSIMVGSYGHSSSHFTINA